MKIIAERRLFWFLKEGAELDLNSESSLDMYAQQVMTHGKTGDIKKLIRTVETDSLKKSFERIKRYLPVPVKDFWEDYFGNTVPASK